MALVAPISQPAIELYLMRFCVNRTRENLIVCDRKYAPLIELAEIEWAFKSTSVLVLYEESSPIDQLTSRHYDLIRENADGISHLFVWFPPPSSKLPTGDEARLMQRAGVVFAHG